MTSDAAASRERPFDVFLSHNGKDKAAVTRLAEKLRSNGLRPWLDIWELTPGGRWQEELHQGIAQSRGCAYFIGPFGEGDWAREELDAARSRAVSDRTFRLFPVLLPGVPDPFDRTTLPPFLGHRTWVDYRAGLDDGDAFQALINAIKGVAPGARALPGSTSDVCPYRGLMAFDEQDARFFHGRDGDVQQLLEKLKASRFLAVMGPSGSGKSSLVRAGLIPALRRGALPGSEDWRVFVLKPGARPLEALAVQIVGQGGPGQALPAGMQATVDGLASDPRTLHLATALALGDTGTRAVWVIDQAEEIFSLCHDEHERAALIENLHYAASVPGGRCVVVLAMRADFYARCAAYPDLAALISTSQFLVGPLSADGLRDAIEQPAHAVGLQLEEGLVPTILDDIDRQPGALPLLEHALLELWDRRRGSMLTLEGYREAGGVQGAIAKRAEAIYSSFTPEEQRIARRSLLRLTQPGEGTEDTRRRAEMRELITRPSEADEVQAVIGELTEARLLTASADPETGATWVDISHEALIRGWPRVRQWLDEDRSALLVHRHITDATQEWERLGRPQSELYRGARLIEAREWRGTHEEMLNERERAFLDASAAEDARQRNLDERRRRRATAIAGGLAAVFLLLTGVASYEWFDALQGRNSLASVADNLQRTLSQRNTALTAAQQQTSLAEARLLAAKALSTESHLDLALLLSAEASRRADAVDVGGALLRELTLEPQLVGFSGNSAGNVDHVAVSADGARFASVTSSGDVTIAATSDPGTPLHHFTISTSGRPSIAFDGRAARLAVSGGQDVQIVNVATGAITATSPTPDAIDLAFVEGTTHLAAMLRDGSVVLLDATSGALVGSPISKRNSGGPEPGLALTIGRLSSDGHFFARVEMNQTEAIYDVETGSVVRGNLDPVSTAHDIAFGPGNRDIAVLHLFGIARYGVSDPSRDDSVRLDVTDPQWLSWIGTGDTARPTDPNGREARAGLVVASTTSGLRWLSDATQSDTGWSTLDRRPSGNQIAVSADGQTVVEGFSDGRLGIWRLSGQSPLARPLDGAWPTLALPAVSPFGVAALAIDPRTGAAYDATSSAIAVRLPDGSQKTYPAVGVVQALALTADGSSLASVEVPSSEGAASELTIRSVSGGKEEFRQTLGALGGAQAQVGLAFPAGGGSIAVGLPDGRLLSLDTATGSTVWTLVVPGVTHVTAAYYSPGNRLFAGVVVSGDGAPSAAVVEINPVSGTLLGGPWPIAGQSVNSLVVDPSGRLLIVAAANGGAPPGGELVAIDLSNPGQPLGTLGPPSDAYAAIGFEAGGRSLISVGATTGWLRWDASVPAWTAEACRIAGRDLTEEEWLHYVGSEPYRPVCSPSP